MRAPTAVEPDLSSPDATSGIFRSFSSSSRKPRNMPRLIPSIISSWVRLCSCCRLHVNSSEALKKHQQAVELKLSPQNQHVHILQAELINFLA